ncbi:MAG TPA: phosphodiester glycosidase family protein [Terrimicrobiaceae bacterium]
MRSCFHVLIFLAIICSSRAGWTLERWKELGALDGNAVAWEGEVSSDGRSIRLSGISFRSADCVFRVIDNPPQERRSLQSALESLGALAGSNGGYFRPDYTPLGLVVRAGKTAHPFERAKLLSGVLIVRKGRIELVRSGNFKPSVDVQEALQAGPWLVEKGRPVTGLNDKRLARRTIVANDGKGHWALIALSPATLADAAKTLCLNGIAGSWTIANALNFDGGSSTALRAVQHERTLIDISSFGPVRNYLAIVSRQQ